MNLPLYHQQLLDFFQRSNETGIFPYKQQGDISLQNLEPSLKNTQESIKAIDGITNALVHLRMNLIIPSQIRFTYVIKKKGVWGLRHVICDRSQEEQIGEDFYNPAEYKYHENSESQLVWNIGRIWLRFFTKTAVRIRFDRQEKINKIIVDHVEDKKIREIILKLLARDRPDRLSFQQFLQDDFFIRTDLQEMTPTSAYSSVLSHFKAMSMVSLQHSTGRLANMDIQNPFVRQIRYRCFFQYLQVDLYFQHVKGQLKDAYFQSGDQQQKELCSFSFYIISLQNYFNMIKLNKERLQIGQRFQELQHRLYYTRFTKRMIKLRQELEKMAKKLRSSSIMSREELRFLRNIDDIVSKDVYIKFKSCLIEYADYLNADLKKNSNDLLALKLLVKIYIIRTSSYVFSQMRNEVFEPFLRIEKLFNIKKVLTRINESNDKKALKELLNNIKNFYFKS